MTKAKLALSTMTTFIAKGDSMTRWTYRRKALIAYAITEGHISAYDAVKLYDVSYDEIAEWLKRLSAGGAKALKATMPRHRTVAQIDTADNFGG